MINTLTTPQHRLAALRLAEQLGNVAEACRRTGLDRTSFYRWRERFLAEGEKGLDNQSRAHRSHPRQTPKHMEVQILRQSLKRPWWGCHRLSAHMRKEGRAVSPSVIQAILTKHHLRTVTERFQVAEKASFGAHTRGMFDPEFTKMLQKRIPRTRRRQWLEPEPGAFWYLDLVMLPKSWWRGAAWLLVAIDAQTGMAYGDLCLDPVNYLQIRRFIQDEVLQKTLQAGHSVRVFKLSRTLASFVSALQSVPLYLFGKQKRQVQLRHDDEPESGWAHSILEWMRRDPTKVRGGREEIRFELSVAIREWLYRYNHSFQIPGHPHFGRTPSQLWDGRSRTPPLPRSLIDDGMVHAALCEDESSRQSAPYPPVVEQAAASRHKDTGRIISTWPDLEISAPPPGIQQQIPQLGPDFEPVGLPANADASHKPGHLESGGPDLRAGALPASTSPSRPISGTISSVRHAIAETKALAYANRCRSCSCLESLSYSTVEGYCTMLRARTRFDDPTCDTNLTSNIE